MGFMLGKPTGYNPWAYFHSGGHTMFEPGRLPIPALALVLIVPAARAGEPEMLPLQHGGAVVTGAFSPDGKQVATGADKVVRLWELATGRETKQIALGEKVGRLAFSPDGRRLVTVSADKNGPLQTWDLATGKIVWMSRVGRGALTSMALSPDGGRVAVGSDDNSVYVYDMPSGKMSMIARGHTGAVTAVAVSPDGKQLATGSADNSVQLWDMATGRVLLRIMGHNKGVECVAFSPDGKTFASGGQDKVVRLWDLATGKELRQFEAKDTVHCIAFSPDAKLVAVVSSDKAVRLIEAATGKESRQFGGLQGKINGLSFSPDGTRVLTAGQDGSAIVWDLKHDEKPLAKDLKLTRKEMDALWTDLGGDDARKAYGALRTLRAAPTDSLPFLRDRLKPAPATVDDKKLAALIADLDNDTFDTREKATKDLEDLGRTAEAALRKAIAAGPSAEAKVRLEKVLAKLGTDAALTPEQTRDLRAVRVLEGLGTAEARKVLEALVRESPGWWVTQEAKAALQRLEREK
jgi:Tol biopolymer transport system component